MTEPKTQTTAAPWPREAPAPTSSDGSWRVLIDQPRGVPTAA